MPKIKDEELKQYFTEIATRAGIDTEKINQAAAVFDDPQFGKVLRENFKPLPNYSSDLDAVRERTKKETSDAWQQENQSLIDKANRVLAAAQDTPPPNQQAQAGLTKEEYAALARQQAEAVAANRDGNYVDLFKANIDHMNRFGKPIDIDGFEKAVKDNDSLRGVPLMTAYKQWIEPKVEEARTADVARQIQQAREEGKREGFTMKSLPTDSGPQQFSPMFDHKQDVLAMTPEQRDEHARGKFMEAFSQARNKTA